MSDLRIHPAIGVARIGNSDQFFIGPEEPGIPANWDAASDRFKPFKDSDGRVLRQAARFRVFQFDADGNPLKEITLDSGAKIEWRVHVANRKASFFSFDGQNGAETNPPYVDRAKRPADDIEKPDGGRGQPLITNRRNARVADRRSIEIDPGEVAVSAPGSVDLVDHITAAPIKTLGRVQMESDGRLLFFGGSGQSGSSDTPPKPIDEYASNDGWFDDMSDGVIQATVTFPDGHTQAATSAWVIVGPPKFAPGIRNVVALYDTLWDMAVRLPLSCQPGSDPTLLDLAAQQQSWNGQTNEFAASYEPSFLRHIYPMLSRALAARDVHQPPPEHPDYHGTLVDWTRLSQRSEDQMRRAVFNRIRDPNSNELNRKNMPRGLGDDYTTLDNFETDPANSPPPSPRAFLSLTKVQYALLKAWAVGRFKEDWTFGDVRFAPIPQPTGLVTPHGLDLAALENCVGGPFYPGIEVSWLIRQSELYAGAFRLKEPGFTIGPLTFAAGFFSQQMALPWHADFYDCHREEHTPDGSDERMYYMWWTAQRPDDIRESATSPYQRWVAAFDAANNGIAQDDPDDITNLARFEQMRTRWSELSFIVLDGDQFVAQSTKAES
jgi:hypothetical protein